MENSAYTASEDREIRNSVHCETELSTDYLKRLVVNSPGIISKIHVIIYRRRKVA